MPSNIRYYTLNFQAYILLSLRTKHTKVLPILFVLDQGPYVKRKAARKLFSKLDKCHIYNKRKYLKAL